MSAERRAALLAQMRANFAEQETEKLTWTPKQWAEHRAEYNRRQAAIDSLRAISDEIGESY
jgi:hypothetical protein